MPLQIEADEVTCAQLAGRKSDDGDGVRRLHDLAYHTRILKALWHARRRARQRAERGIRLLSHGSALLPTLRGLARLRAPLCRAAPPPLGHARDPRSGR